MTANDQRIQALEKQVADLHAKVAEQAEGAHRIEMWARRRLASTII
jgi:hypothetical protein